MRQALKRTGAVDARGFTLVEILIVMAITGIVMTAIYSIFLISNRSYRTQDNVADAQQRVRVGVDFIAHDLRLAGLDPLSAGSGIENAGASDLRLTADLDLNGAIDAPLNQERVTYDYDAASRTLRRRLYEGTADQTAWVPLIDNVGSLTFTYRDSNGNVTANLNDIRMVDITMVCQATDAQGQTINRTLRTRVICRNLYM